MASIRAFELAKELGIPFPRLKKEAKAIGVDVRIPLAQLQDADAESIRNRFRTPSEPSSSAKQSSPQKKKKRAVSTKSAKGKIAEASVKATARVPAADAAAAEEPPEPVAPVAPPPVEIVEEKVPERPRREKISSYEEILEEYIPPPVAKRQSAAAAVAPPPAPEPAAEKPAAKKPATKKPATKKPATKKPAAKKRAGAPPAVGEPTAGEQLDEVDAPAAPVARPRRGSPAVAPPPAAAATPSKQAAVAPPAAAATPAGPATSKRPAAVTPVLPPGAPERPAAVMPPGAVTPPGATDGMLSPAASADGTGAPDSAAVPIADRKGPGLVRPAAPRPEPEQVTPSLDRTYVARPLEVYEAGPRREGKRRKKAKDRRKEAAAADTGGRKAFSLDLGSEFVSTRVTKKREKSSSNVIEVEVPCTLKALSSAIGIKVNNLMTRLMRQGHMVGINELVDRDIVELLGLEFDLEIEAKEQVEVTQEDLVSQIVDNETDRVPRAPIVTFLGHVDHGKTSLLDKIRSATVAAGEAGGITQHITCYRVDRDDKAVVFVDTPGHAAFSEMRARGANITDVVVLVVAADDGPMPQTEEAIAHARAAEVPIVVAINKIDKVDANPQLTKQKLSALGLQPEEWGGDCVMVEVSAETGAGIDDLLEYLSLESELLDLKANALVAANGTVLEARRTEGRGIVADVLVQNGTLSRGDVLLAGSSFGRVKQIFDTSWKPIKSAGPATPVWVTGLNEVPDAGEKFVVVADIVIAQERAEQQRLSRRHKELATRRRRHASLESLFADLESASSRELRLIVKSDVAGSLEAIKNELAKLSTDDINLRIIHSATGGVTEGDIALADASDAIIIGFNVTAEERARGLAKARGVQVRHYSIIYKIIDEIRDAMEGLLEPEEVEEIIGHAEVRQVFQSSKVGKIAGCRVVDGLVRRGSFVRVARNNIVIYPSDESVKRGTLTSLKRLKDDAREVERGAECGIKVKDYEDVKAEDVLEFYEIKKVKRLLES